MLHNLSKNSDVIFRIFDTHLYIISIDFNVEIFIKRATMWYFCWMKSLYNINIMNVIKDH